MLFSSFAYFNRINCSLADPEKHMSQAMIDFENDSIFSQYHLGQQLVWVPFRPSALPFALINVKAYFTNQGACYRVKQRGSLWAGSHHGSLSKGSLPPQPCQGMCAHHGFQHSDASSQTSQISLIGETAQPEFLLC